MALSLLCRAARAALKGLARIALAGLWCAVAWELFWWCATEFVPFLCAWIGNSLGVAYDSPTLDCWTFLYLPSAFAALVAAVALCALLWRLWALAKGLFPKADAKVDGVAWLDPERAPEALAERRAERPAKGAQRKAAKAKGAEGKGRGRKADKAGGEGAPKTDDGDKGAQGARDEKEVEGR